MALSTRTFLSLLVAWAVFLPSPARAKSVKDFEAMPTRDQSEYVVSYLEKMTYEIGKVDPALARQMKDYFVVEQPGKKMSGGIEQLGIQLAVVDDLARQGKADPSNIQVESIIVWVVKQKFPPPSK